MTPVDESEAREVHVGAAPLDLVAFAEHAAFEAQPRKHAQGSRSVF